MRVFSREMLVRFLPALSLALALVVAACQPIQPVSDVSSPAATDSETQANIGGSEPITEAVSVGAAADISDTTFVTESTASAEPGANVGEPVSTTVAVGDSAIVVATGTVEATEEATTDPALLEAGFAVYRAQYCGVCHTLDAAETRGTFGPPHNGMRATAAARLLEENYSGSATNAAEYIRESIVEPQVYIAPGYATTSHRMPTYAHLDSASIDALVAFLLAQ